MCMTSWLFAHIFGKLVNCLFYFYPKSLLMLIHYTLPLPVCLSPTSVITLRRKGKS